MPEVDRSHACRGRHPSDTMDTSASQSTPHDRNEWSRSQCLVNQGHPAVPNAPSALTQSRRVGRGFHRPVWPEEPARSEQQKRPSIPPSSHIALRRGTTVTRPLVEIVASSRAQRLVHQSFRLDQMTGIDIALADKTTDGARNGIHLALRTAHVLSRTMLTEPYIGSAGQVRTQPSMR